MVSRDRIEYEFNPYRRKVMGALCLTKLSGTDFRVVLLILAQTDGYRRTEDKIKPAFFEGKTGLSKGNVRRTVARLRGWHMISKQGQFYTVLPPGQWDKEVFVELQGRFNIEALSTTNSEEIRFNPEAHEEAEEEANRFNSEAQTPPGRGPDRFNSEAEASPDSGDRFNSEAPTASILKHPELKSEAVLASSKENLSKENLSKDIYCKEISILYEENIGFIKPALAEEIKDFCENFSGPAPWIKLAFKEALSRNKKSWQYIRTILESWEEKGGPDDRTRGQPSKGVRPKPAQGRVKPIKRIRG